MRVQEDKQKLLTKVKKEILGLKKYGAVQLLDKDGSVIVKDLIALDSVIEVIDELDELEKVVVPRFVGEWYEENIDGGYVTGDKKFSGNDIFRVIQDAIKVQNDETTWGDFAVDEKIAKFASENEETFLNLLVNCSYRAGYTLEKKKKYTVSHPQESTDFWFLTKDNSGRVRVGTNIEYFKAGWENTKLTQQEIEEFDKKYMVFAKEVIEDES